MPKNPFNLIKLKPIKIRPWFYWVGGGVVLAVLLGLLGYWSFQVSQSWTSLQKTATDENKKRFDASLEIAKTIVGGIGSIATIGGGFFVLWNIRLTQARLITERFSKAVEQLGSDKIEVRLGGIYALERIAYDSDRDHWTIMEVLTSFIQERSPIKPIPKEQIRSRAYEIWQKSSGSGTDEERWEDAKIALAAEQITKDIQAALTVIGRRQQKDPPGKQIDLTSTNLSGTNLRDANLQKAVLWNANLQKANIGNANLQETDLRDANLQKADLRDANLQKADLRDANLQKADLRDANLQKAVLWNANLQEAILVNANLQEAVLIDARLQKAVLWNANLQKANIGNANLQEADLWNANLQKAVLINANLQKAVLRNTRLQEAVLLTTDLRQTTCLTQEQFEGEEKNRPLLCNVVLPKGLTVDPNQDCDRIPQELHERLTVFDTIDGAKWLVDKVRQQKWE